MPCVLRRQTASEHEVGEVVCQAQDVTCDHSCVGSHTSSAAGRSHNAEQVCDAGHCPIWLGRHVKFNDFGNNQQHHQGKRNGATSPVWEEVLANALQDGAGSKGKCDDDVVEWASAKSPRPTPQSLRQKHRLCLSHVVGLHRKLIPDSQWPART